VIVAAAAVAAVALAALPEGTVRLRAELGGEPVGVAELRVACGAAACAVSYASELVPPEEAGGPTRRTRVEAEVDRDGRWVGGPLKTPVPGAGVRGAVPSALVEVVLLGAVSAAPDGQACVPFFDELEPGEGRQACARRAGDHVLAQLGEFPVRIVPGEDGFPREVLVGRFRWIRDPAARLPAHGPRVAGARVPGPDDPGSARRFCGVRRDAPATATAPAETPAPRAAGASCREKTAAWLAEARRRGLEGRTAVGVAWDGGGFVWHAWAEVRVGAAWVPVDPSFGQLPARGPRFTVARFGEGDAPAREAAGDRILGCWGVARVE
jgi:hypothetical protein